VASICATCVCIAGGGGPGGVGGAVGVLTVEDNPGLTDTDCVAPAILLTLTTPASTDTEVAPFVATTTVNVVPRIPIVAVGVRTS